MQGIFFDDKTRVFGLYTEHSCYQMQVISYGYLVHLYYGANVGDTQMTDQIVFLDRGFSPNPWEADRDRTFSPDSLPLEYSGAGSGDYRISALEVENGDGSCAADLRFESYEIRSGKYALEGLPAMCGPRELPAASKPEKWPAGGEAEKLPASNEPEEPGDAWAAFCRRALSDVQTLEICLKDPVSSLRVHLLYGVYPHLDIITRAVRIENAGTETVRLHKVMSAQVDFLHRPMDLLHFHGRHCMERQMERRSLGHGVMSVGSTRGASSHQHNPFVILCDPSASETTGDCYGFSLVYSGNFIAEAERDQFEQTRVVLGIHPFSFLWQLEPGESFTAPELIMGYAERGFSELSHKLHDAFRCALIHRGGSSTLSGAALSGPAASGFAVHNAGTPGAASAAVAVPGAAAAGSAVHNAATPEAAAAGTAPSGAAMPGSVLINNWEATYFAFDEEKLLQIARNAKTMGVDLFVLDDGWFGSRDSDYAGLGDWIPNESKLGGSLASLAEKIRAMDMQMGLWVEPEMVSEDSRLYREHPDWCVHIPGRKPGRGRYQLNLDISRKEVRDTVLDMLFRVIDECGVTYLKWDMNRSLGNAYGVSLPPSRQGEFYHRYVLGVYDMMERLVSRYPGLLLENCAGGGGRFDAGMLYYSPQIWCSDNTDAVDRLKIQYGTSFAYPVSTMGAHISVCPNHQTGCSTPLQTRAAVARAGTFGLEMDPGTLSPEEKDQIREEIDIYRRMSPLIKTADYYRLGAGENGWWAWAFVSKDRRQAFVEGVILRREANGPVHVLRLRGLDATAHYRRTDLGQCSDTGETGRIYTGAALMKAGILLPLLEGEYRSFSILLECCPENSAQEGNAC